MLKQTLTAAVLALSSTLVAAQDTAQYEITITNITPGQTFTPQLVVTHPNNYFMFRLGESASEELEILAEGGDTAPLTDAVANIATDVATIDGLLGPGETTSIIVNGIPQQGFVSIAAMLIPTNDTFMAANHIRLPSSGAKMRMVPAYDAGTEENDQSCQNMPGPRCGGEGYVGTPGEGDEGFVHIGNGFHELGNEDADGAEVLGPQTYDWRNSVARITVRYMN